MANDLTAKFGAQTSGFSAGVEKIKSELSGLNTSLAKNKQEITAVNKEIRQLTKEQEQLAKEMQGGATKEQEKQMQDLSDKIAQANTKLGQLKTTETELKSDIKNITAELNNQKTSSESVSKSLDSCKTSLSELGAMAKTAEIGYGALVTAMATLTATAGKNADDINTLAKTYGLSTEEIQKFNYATEIIDVSLETLTATQTKNIRSMTAYQKGTEATVNAYKELGIEVENADGSLRDSHTVYNELITALGNIEDSTKRDSLAMTLLGKSAQELNPLILGGAEALADLGDQAEKMGLILPQEDLDRLNTFNDKIDVAKANMSALSMVVATEFAESFDSGFEAVDDFQEFIQGLKDDGTLADMAKALGDSIKSLVNIIENAVSIGWKYRNVIIAGVAAMASFKVSMSVGTLIASVSTAIKQLTNANNAATVSQTALNTAMKANPYVLVASSILSIVSAVSAFAIANSNASGGANDLRQNVDKLTQSAETAKEKITSLKEISRQYSEIKNSQMGASEKTEKLTSLQDLLNDSYSTASDNIDLVNGKYDENIAKLKEAIAEELKLARAKAQVAVNDVKKAEEDEKKVTYTDNEGSKSDLKFGNVQGAIKDVAAQLENVTVNENGFFGFEVNVSGNAEEKLKAYEALMRKFEEKGLDKYEYGSGYGSEYYDLLKSSAEEYKEKVDANKKAVEMLKNIEELLSETQKDNTKALDDNADSRKRWHEQASESIVTSEQLAEQAKENSSVVSGLTSEYDKLCKVFEEQNKNGQLSLSTVAQMIESGYGACLMLDEETGAIKLNEQAYRDLIQTKIDVQNASLALERQELNLLNVQLASQAASAAQARDDTRLAEIQNQITANDQRLAAIAATSALYDKMSNGMNSPSSSGGNDEDDYTKGYNAYKTEADKKLELINRELEAKKKLHDETIKAIDDEIQARKRLNEDNDIQEEIDAVQAQLKYSKLDDFSRMQLQKQLSDLKDKQAETAWERSMEDQKAQADEEYDAAQDVAEQAKETITDGVNTFKQIMDALRDGITNVSEVINNNNSNVSNTANINLASQALTMGQIEQAVRNALMDCIV